MAVLSELSSVARSLVAGDILVLYYSGHGGQIGDVNRDESDDGLDETWCLYDRMLVDDELYAMWSQFKAGVRILVISDSCHSGTVIKDNISTSLMNAEFVKQLYKSNVPVAFKAIPFTKSWDIYQSHKDTYDLVQYLSGQSDRNDIRAGVILISGCQDNQFSADGISTDTHPNSYFTAKVIKVWNNGKFAKNHISFHKEITDGMPPTQTPSYYTVGSINMEFESQTPFTITTNKEG
jgi:hypothetical protein